MKSLLLSIDLPLVVALHFDESCSDSRSDSVVNVVAVVVVDAVVVVVVVVVVEHSGHKIA